jgi:acyltransferase
LLKNYVPNLYFQITIVFLLAFISFYIELPFCIDQSFNILVFLFIGCFLSASNFFLFIISIIIAGSLYFLNGIPSLDIATKTYSNVIINDLWALSISYIIIVFCKYFGGYKFFYIFNKWGTNTMLLFVIHPYTNNIAHIIVKNVLSGSWYLKLLLSLLMLQGILFIKQKYPASVLFKYV